MGKGELPITIVDLQTNQLTSRNFAALETDTFNILSKSGVDKC
jgi:hypothetical protein